MKQFYRLMRLLAVAAAISLPPVSGAAEPPAVRLVYFSNLPDIDDRPGLPEAAGLVESLRADGSEVYLIHGGDSLAPSTLSAFDRGAHMIALLNTLDPVAMGVAKREFAFGEDELSLRSYEAAFPMISNNLEDPATGAGLDGLVDASAFAAGPWEVCVTAAVSMELQESYMPERVRTRDPIATTRRVASRLRDEGCDLVMSLFGALEPGQQTLLNEKVVDLVISAESHVEPAVDLESGVHVTVRASQPSAVVIELAGERTADCVICDAQIVTLDSAQASAELLAQISVYQAKLSEILEIPVGTARTELDTRRDVIRTGEAAFGNLVADALRSAVGADVALINSGGIRGNRVYAANSVLTRGDIQRELPFRNRVVLLEVTGSRLRAALENGLTGYDGQTGAFPQVSGIAVSFDPEAPIGARVTAVSVDGAELRNEQLYTLATLDFLAGGGDGYAALNGARQLRSSINALLWETVRSYISAREEVAPEREGRLVNVRD